jgi:DNA-directed RNA polymerase subunit E'/Rpb7
VYIKIDLDRWQWSTSEDEDETAKNKKPVRPRISNYDKKQRKQAIVPEMDTSDSSSSDSDDDEGLDFRDMLNFD